MQTSCTLPWVSLFRHQETDTLIFMWFSYTMHCSFNCVLSLCNFHISFLFTDCTRKETLVIKRFFFAFVKGWTSISQTNNLQRMKMKSDTLFTLSSTLKQGLLSFRPISWQKHVMRFIFWQSCMLRVCNFTKNVFLSKHFRRILLRFGVICQESWHFKKLYFPGKPFSCGW